MNRDKPDAWEVQEPWSMQGKGRNVRRTKSDNRYVESIRFVPHAPRSTLRNNLIRELLMKKDPNPEHCGRNTCLPCKSRVGACLRKGAVYKISCMTCKTEGSRDTVYLEETARTMFDRGRSISGP